MDAACGCDAPRVLTPRWRAGSKRTERWRLSTDLQSLGTTARARSVPGLASSSGDAVFPAVNPLETADHDSRLPPAGVSSKPGPDMCAHLVRVVGHADVVVAVSQLLVAVDAAFARASRDLAPWSNPHPDRAPLEEEYSRLSRPARWRIVGARAEAWLTALIEMGLAGIELDAPVRWRDTPSPQLSRVDRVDPLAIGALPMIVARSRAGEVDDAGIVLGAGDPSTCLGWFPSCGCDACDSGSQDELDNLDRHLLAVVAGTFRHLSDGRRNITVLDEHGWSASGPFRRGEVDAILHEPSGWSELVGASWLTVR
jgi:hypothetical protein